MHYKSARTWRASFGLPWDRAPVRLLALYSMLLGLGAPQHIKSVHSTGVPEST